MSPLSNLPKELLTLIASLLDISSCFVLTYLSKHLMNFGERKNIDKQLIVIDAICNGYTELFKLFVSNKTMFSTKNMRLYCIHAATHGRHEILQHLYKDNPCRMFSEHIMSLAAKGGHFEIVKWLRGIGCRWDVFSTMYAAGYGHFEILKWLCENGCPINSNAFMHAVSDPTHPHLKHIIHEISVCSGYSLNEIAQYELQLQRDRPKTQNSIKLSDRIEILEWLTQNSLSPTGHLKFISIECSCDAAAFSGNFEILKFLGSTCSHQWSASTFTNAARHNSLEILKWLHTVGCPWNENTFATACKFCDLEILQWLKDSGCRYNSSVYASAARYNRMDVVKWLMSHVDCEPNASACVGAARGGHLDMLKHLLKCGCDWDKYACIGATKGGHLEVLKYLIGHRYEWHSDCFGYAISCRHSDIIQYYIESFDRNELDGDNILTHFACVAAAITENIDVLRFIYSNRPIKGKTMYPFGAAVSSYACMNGSLKTAKYLHEIGCDFDEMACAKASFGGHYELLKWLRTKFDGGKGCPWNEYSTSYNNKHLEIIKYLHDNRCPCDKYACIYCKNLTS